MNYRELSGIAALVDAYNDAYDAAFSSIQGQYDLWDKADKVTAVSAGSIADEIEGLRGVIDSFVDGSAESVTAIAGIKSWQGHDTGLRQAATNAMGMSCSGTWAAQFDPVHSGRGYASGTSSAPSGWAWAGEEGAELIRMQGGETVLPAEISREFAILTAYGNEVAAYANGTDKGTPRRKRWIPCRPMRMSF